MALIIDTDEAGRLARELAHLTGETMAEAVTEALRQRLRGVRRSAVAASDVVVDVQQFARSVAHRYDRRPITQVEWDAAGGDNFDRGPA